MIEIQVGDETHVRQWDIDYSVVDEAASQVDITVYKTVVTELTAQEYDKLKEQLEAQTA